MTVEAMKKVLIVCPRDRETSLLDALQRAGLVHLSAVTVAGEDMSQAAVNAKSASRALAGLRAFQDPKYELSGAVSAKLEQLSDAQLLQHVQALLARRFETQGHVAQLVKELKHAQSFGKTSRRDFEALAKRGITLRVYQLPKNFDAKALLPAKTTSFPITYGNTKALVVASWDKDFELNLDKIEPPDRPSNELCSDLERTRKTLAKIDDELHACATLLPRVGRETTRLNDVHQLQQARRHAGGNEALFALRGWCPASATKQVAKVVQTAAGACVFDPPRDGEEPPIKLRNTTVVSWFEPLLEAFQLPHYREPDPTILFAPFMAVFFGFCLGDMAYGALLLLAATLLYRRLARGSEAGLTMRRALRLMQLLGATTVVVGFLTGSAFGYPLYEIEALQRAGLTSDKLLFFLNKDPQNLFYASLLFGVAQLGLGIFVRLVLELRRGHYQHAIGTLGWLLLFPGVGLWIGYGASYLFVAALVLIVLFKSPGGVLKRLGGGLWGLYDWVLGLFGDVMSYLRIFGLGLSSGIIAQVVNTIAWMVLSSGSVAGYIGGVLILLIGHTFNFAMAVLGSTVHAARLQFLEFFGKFYEGGGQAFRPFARGK